jgi:hypothetical protein
MISTFRGFDLGFAFSIWKLSRTRKFGDKLGVDYRAMDWQVKCDQATFERCKNDDKFAYIVTLARAVNAVYFVHSAISNLGEDRGPGAMRDRFNSYLFGSAIMYEALELIRKMNQPFSQDEVFQNGLRLLLKDKAAKHIERDI